MGVAGAMSPLVSEERTASGTLQDSTAAPANIAGAGYVTGFTLGGGAGATLTVRDTDVNGRVLFGPLSYPGNGAPNAVFPPQEQWQRYTSGIHIVLSGTSPECTVHYKPD